MGNKFEGFITVLHLKITKTNVSNGGSYRQNVCAKQEDDAPKQVSFHQRYETVGRELALLS